MSELTQQDLKEMISFAGKLNHLSDRWENTKEWHEPLFLSGKIEITTEDLKKHFRTY